MKWCVITKVWNEADHIESCIKALYGVVDHVIVIDGAYRYFPYMEPNTLYEKTPNSSDGTLDIVREIISEPAEEKETEVNIINPVRLRPWRCETQMLNYAIHFCPKVDYVIFIDGHEILQGDFERQTKIIEDEQWSLGKIVVYLPQNDRLAVPFEELDWDYARQCTHYRILKWHPKLRARQWHWNWVLEDSGQLRGSEFTFGLCKHIRLTHLTRHRERERINQVHKRHIGKFNANEAELLKWRKKHKIPDGYVE